jgi:hypothetical protein
MVRLLGMEVVVIDSGVSFFDPSRADEVGIDPGRRGAQGGWGVLFSAVGEDDVFQVIVAEGVVGEGLTDGGLDFGRSEEVEEGGDFFELVSEVEFGIAKGGQVLLGRLAQG